MPGKQPAKIPQASNGSLVVLWEGCHNIPVLGNCCVEVQAAQANLTIFISLIVHGNVVHTQELSAGELCLTQDEVSRPW